MATVEITQLIPLILLITVAQAQLFGGGNSTNATGTLQTWLATYIDPTYQAPDSYSGIDSGLATPIRRAFPTPSLSASTLQSFSLSAIQPYAISLGAVVGPGFVLALLSLVIAVFYIPVRCCVACCHRKKKTAKSPPPPVISVHSGSSTVALFVSVMLLGSLAIVGSAFGFAANRGFSTDLTALQGTVFSAIDDVLFIGNGVYNLTVSAPGMIDGLIVNIEGLVLAVIPEFRNRTESLLTSFTNVTNQIDAANAKLQSMTTPPQPTATAVSNLAAQANATRESIVRVNNDITPPNGSLAQIVNQNLTLSLNMSQLNATLFRMLSTVNQYSDLGRKYANMVIGYDAYRFAGFNVLFALPIISFATVALAAFLAQGWLFHATVFVGFIVLFFSFALGAVHLTLAIVIGGACDMIATVPVPLMAVDVLQGCSNPANASLLAIAGMNLNQFATAYNVSDITSATSYTNTFNGTTVSSFLGEAIAISHNDTTNATFWVGYSAQQAETNYQTFDSSLTGFTNGTISAITNAVRTFVTGFTSTVDKLDNCTFAPRTFYDMIQEICHEFPASLDVMWLGFFTVALFTIPALIIESILIKRFKQHTNEQRKRHWDIARPFSRNAVAPSDITPPNQP